jgi:hypothetical protein
VTFSGSIGVQVVDVIMSLVVLTAGVALLGVPLDSRPST